MPRISQLPSLTAADNTDEIAIVDVSASTTKKITRGDLLKAPLPTKSVTLPAINGGTAAGVLMTDASGNVSVNSTPAATSVVATSQTTTSTSFADLATVQSISVTVGNSGILIIQVTANMANNTAFSGTVVGFALSGANTLAAADARSIQYQSTGANNYHQQSGVFMLTGLTPGATTVTMKFKVISSGTGSFHTRTISGFSL